jgi:hypothetical protein
MLDEVLDPRCHLRRVFDCYGTFSSFEAVQLATFPCEHPEDLAPLVGFLAAGDRHEALNEGRGSTSSGKAAEANAPTFAEPAPHQCQRGIVTSGIDTFLSDGAADDCTQQRQIAP